MIIGRPEITNYFQLQDLRQLGHITKEQGVHALRQIAFSELHVQKIEGYSIPDSLDLE